MNNTEWQPIDTAPKDGNDILFCFHYNDDKEPIESFIKITYWSGAEKGWAGYATSIRNNIITPTHWMPLPTPPQN